MTGRIKTMRSRNPVAAIPVALPALNSTQEAIRTWRATAAVVKEEA
jgi:hypothetical protein